MADQHDFETFGVLGARLDVHFGNQRTNGVDAKQVACLGCRGDALGDPMCRKDHRCGRFRDLVELLHKNGAFRLEIINHVAIVDDLVSHIDRRSELLQRQFDDPDGAIDAGAKAAWCRQQDGQRWQRPPFGPDIGHG